VSLATSLVLSLAFPMPLRVPIQQRAGFVRRSEEICAEASYRTMLLAQQVDSGAFVGLCEGLEVLEGMRACVGR